MDEHYTALRTLAAVGLLEDRVFDTVRVDPDGGLIRDQYLILYRSTPEEIASERFMKAATFDDALTFEWDFRAVGVTAGAAGDVAVTFLRNVIGGRLVVAGRACTPIAGGASGRVLPDTSVRPHLFTVTGSVTTISRPA